jgi:hypothetical protein
MKFCRLDLLHLGPGRAGERRTAEESAQPGKQDPSQHRDSLLGGGRSYVERATRGLEDRLEAYTVLFSTAMGPV